MLWDKKRFKLLTHFSPSLENFIMAKVVFLNHNSRLITEIMSDIMSKDLFTYFQSYH